MLELKQITKDYIIGDEVSVVLKGINLSFGESEFVSILGQSGSGKTTLLNIIGGLDNYTTGDLIVDGTSTSNFKDRDWDSYRNGTIGFVFQSYNLISHLSILDNVKMALSLSGISSKESTKRATKALHEVGLEDHLHKRPSQLSGGQMQRVAIARALVNNPKILLADEPTGALDTQTSIQIMDLIKKISKDRLVIMVTHNPELAEEYSDRIIRLSDGLVIEDTAPYVESDSDSSGYKEVKTSMSFWAAIKSSAKNLWTKKTRTLLVSFAGSIGIISIGLVLALSNGMTGYIDVMQSDSLTGTPITISDTESGIMAAMAAGPVVKEEKKEVKDKVVPAKTLEQHQNKYAVEALGSGETFIDYFEKNASDYYTSISYSKGYTIKAVTKNKDGDVQEVKHVESKNSVMQGPPNPFKSSSLFTELPEDEAPVLNQYEVLDYLGDKFVYPTKATELVLVIGKDNTLSPDTLKALGYASDEEVNFSDILGQKISIIENDNYYEELGDTKHYVPSQITEDMYSTGIEAEIVAILKPKEASATLISSELGYTKALSDQLIEIEKESEIVHAQVENSERNVLSPSNEKLDKDASKKLLQSLGGDDTPTQISIYPTTFEERKQVVEVINDYNGLIEDEYGLKTDKYDEFTIQYTDMASLLTQTMSTMIDSVTVILTAFAAISLIVSSIMIGILTYVSVVERTKEIGIMRAIGARKKDITRIFNAESIIIGLLSGLTGIGITYLCLIPINSVVEKSLGIPDFVATLPLRSAVILVALSVFLTFIAGYIPAKGAAKKDAIEALRSE